MLVEDEHSISVLTEQILYPRIRAFDEDDNMDDKTKAEKKQEAINVFVREYSKKSELLSEDEIARLVKTVLQRTIDNIKGQNR